MKRSTANRYSRSLVLPVLTVLALLVGGTVPLGAQEQLSLEEVIAAVSDSFQEAGKFVVESPQGGAARGIGTRKKLIRKVLDVETNLLNKASADGLCISSMVAMIEVRVEKTTDGIKVGAKAPEIGEASVGFGEGETVAVATVEVTCINPKCRADT
jgi:hypothetical protein